MSAEPGRSFSEQPDVLATVLDVAQQVLQADAFAVWRLEHARWQIRAYAGISDTFANHIITTYRSAPVTTVDSVDPLLFEDVRLAPTLEERLPAYEREGIRSLALIPLLISGQTSGSLVLYYRTPHQFTPAEIETARALGRTAAAALTARERSDFLDRASTALGESLDLRATAQTVVDLAVPFFADTCAIHVPGAHGEVELAAASHVDPSKHAAMLLLAGRPPNRARGWGRTIAAGVVQLFEQIDEAAVRETLGDDPALRAAFDELRLVSQLSVPMHAHGRLVGAVTFALAPGPRRFGAGDVEFAHDLARRCAIAIDNARLYEEAQRREAEAAWAEQRATFLAEAGAALASSLDYDQTLRAVAQLAVPRIADWCAVDVVDAGGAIERLVATHVNPAKAELVQVIREQHHVQSSFGAGPVVASGQPTIVPHVTDEMIVAAAQGDEERIALARQLGVTSYLCVPLLIHGRAIGALSFAVTESSRRFTVGDLRFAQEVAARAALAIENSRAYAEARRANRVKDEFLATLSHELRTPLNAVMGYTRMLRDGTLGAEKHDRALMILERNASTLAQIVEDILDVSRITVGKLRLDPRPTDLGAIVGDAISAILPAAEARGVAVRSRVDPRLGIIQADSDRLRQVVWNLVSNAVKFTPQGGSVDVLVEAGDNAAVILVRDTGIGISREFLPHVFERFRTADSGLTRQHGGLGLGLAIARHLVEMHGGAIHAASDGAGKGATFRVELPLSPRPAEIGAEK